ncbi:MAG: DMT family transporter [Oceanisphaera sp.]
MSHLAVSSPHSIFLSVLSALIAVILWSIAPLLVDAAGVVPPLRLASIALFSGAVAALPMALRRPKPKQNTAVVSVRWKLVIYGLVPALMLGAVGSYLAGMGKAPAAEAALITYTWPVMFIVISHWMFYRYLSMPVLLGALTAFCGAAILLSPESSSVQGSGQGLGYALALLAACCWALYSWICQVAPLAIAPMMPTLFLIAAGGAATGDLLLGGTSSMPSGSTLAAGVALGLGPYGLAMVAWDLALRTGPAALVGSLAYAVPVLAAAFLVIAGIAAPDWRLPVAACLVVVGAIIASLKRSHKSSAMTI